MPTLAGDGIVRRMRLGTAATRSAPLSARITDIDLQAGAVLEEAATPGETAFAVIRAGEVQTATGPAGPGTTVLSGGAPRRLTARSDARLTLFAGLPCGTPPSRRVPSSPRPKRRPAVSAPDSPQAGWAG